MWMTSQAYTLCVMCTNVYFVFLYTMCVVTAVVCSVPNWKLTDALLFADVNISYDGTQHVHSTTSPRTLKLVPNKQNTLPSARHFGYTWSSIKLQSAFLHQPFYVIWCKIRWFLLASQLLFKNSLPTRDTFWRISLAEIPASPNRVLK